MDSRIYKRCGLQLLLPQIPPTTSIDVNLETAFVGSTMDELAPVRLSFRFNALWERHNEVVFFYSIIDGEKFGFSLTSWHTTEIQVTVRGKVIPQIYVPETGTSWSSLHETLVHRFSNDALVRAISAAVMLSTRPIGRHKGAAEALLPEHFRTLESSLEYDTPIDLDMISVIADARSAYGQLIFDCSAGYTAKSTVNSSIGTLTRIERPIESEEFEESGSMLMPFLFE